MNIRALFGGERSANVTSNPLSVHRRAMLVVLLATLLARAPATPPGADSTDTLDACLAQAPIQSPPPLNWGEGVPQMWSSTPPVPRDTIRASLSRVRSARACLRALDASSIERPYLGNIMRTFRAETALLAALGRFSEAFEAFEDTRTYLESPPSIPAVEGSRMGWARALHQDQGFLHYQLGDLSTLISHYLSALKETPREKIDLRVTYLLDVGALYKHTQDYHSAHHYSHHCYRRARRLAREHGRTPEQHPAEWARLLYHQADLLLEETLNTEFDRAPLRRARDLARRGRSLATDPEQRTDLTLTLSESLRYLEAFDRACTLNAEARRYAQAQGDAPLRAFALLKLGVLHMQTERWSEAESALNTSLAIAERMGNLDYQRRIRRGLGRLHELQRDWAAAEAQYRKGVAVTEQYRESLTATQWSSTAFAQWRDVHRGLVRTLLAQTQPRAALTASRARLDNLGRALMDVRNRLGTDSLSDATEADPRAREATLMASRQRVLRLDSARTSRPSVDEISESIARQDRALVSYFLDAPWPVYDRPPRSAAFVLTGDTLRAVPLPALTQDSVRTYVSSISPLFTSQEPSQRVNAMHFDLRPLHALHDRLYAPVAEHLPDGQPLTVIPDGPMFHVPFSMLATATPGGRYDHARARFVLQERPTALDLSASIATDTSRDPDRASYTPDLAAFGVSSFDEHQDLPRFLQSPPSDTTRSAGPLPSLSGVQSELDGLLFLHELQGRHRSLPLAVLSGCSTARGTLRGGEGMAGLQYAFRAMGADATVANLWPTADETSVALMENFYQNLQAGQPKDQALRRAKLAYRDNHPNAVSAFFWAPTVLYGSPRPLQLEASPRSLLRSWWAGGLVLLAALFAWTLVWGRSRAGIGPF